MSKRTHEQAGVSGTGAVKRPRNELTESVENRNRSLFAGTVYRTVTAKQAAFDMLSGCLPVTALVVAAEAHFDREAIHHHIFVKTTSKFTVCEMRKLIAGAYGLPATEADLEDEANCRLWVTPVTSERNYLKYITKEDSTPLVMGVPKSSLSFQCQALEWAKSTENFSYADPFVLNHPQYFRLLENVFEDVKKSEDHLDSDEQYLRTYSYCRPAPHTFDIFNMNRFNGNEPPPIPTGRREHRDDNTTEVVLRNRTDCRNNWRADVIDWWNEFVCSGHTHKKKQLYLQGLPDVGKTFFVNWLLRTCANTNTFNKKLFEGFDTNTTQTYTQFVEERDNDSNNEFEQRVFRPTPHDFRFAWQDFDARAHNLVMCDELHLPHQFDVSDFKKAAAGEFLIANVKGRTAKKIRLKLPMIFISNHVPPQDAANVGIVERLHIVEALGSYKLQGSTSS